MTRGIRFTAGLGRTVLLGALCGAIPLAAQTPEKETGVFKDTLTIEIVNIEVFVSDRQGNPVHGLGRQDFQLLVDGEPTPIVNFYAEVDGEPVLQSSSGDTLPPAGVAASLPEPAEQRLHIVIFIDCSQSLPHNRRAVFRQLDALLESMLSPGDVVAVMSYDQAIKIHSGFLADDDMLREILSEIEAIVGESPSTRMEYQEIASELLASSPNSFGRNEVSARNATLLRRHLLIRLQAFAQVNYNRNLNSIKALQSVVRTLAAVNGRKALIHVSDGVVTNPGEGLYTIWQEIFNDYSSYQRKIGSFDILPELDALAREANAGQVTIYTIDAEPDHKGLVQRSAALGSRPIHIPAASYSIMEANAREPLESAAHSTGGLRVQSSWRLDQDLQRIAGDLGTCYSLGYKQKTPGKRKSHRIEVKVVDKKGLRVRHRESFVADSRSDDERFAAEVKAAALLGATNNAFEAELDVKEELRRLDDESSTLPVKVLLPIKNLLLLPKNEAHEASLSFFVSVKDRDGSTRPVQKLQTRLRIPTEELAQARATFAIYDVSIILRAGDQRAVIGVRDDTAAATGTVLLDLTPWSAPETDESESADQALIKR
jgi:VWFA-related protein